MITPVTIAVAVKVYDGMVLAADSATTLANTGPNGELEIANIYNNANKIFNLHKGLPIGGMTWGLGNVGPATIASLAKELRRRLAGHDPANLGWKIDPDNYTVRDVADRVRELVYDEQFQPLFAGAATTAMTELGLYIGGYSSGAPLPEGYLITMSPANGCDGPTPYLSQGETGAAWWGQPEAITRLMNGISPALPAALENLGVPVNEVDAYTAQIMSQLQVGMTPQAMPVQDAIELAEFLVDTTIKFVRFCPGHATVGGPIEVAAITRHEGYKWIKRKHYYRRELNPGGEVSP